MPRLPAIRPKDLVKKFHQIGFVKDHQTGSHVVMYHPKTHQRATIPYHLKDIKKGTLNSILKESGVSREQILK